MIDHRTIPALAICDECGAEAETTESRSGRGELIQGNMPAGWAIAWEIDPPAHRCPGCIAANAEPFGDRRAAFEARLEQLGPALIADIAESLSMPVALGRVWAEQQRRAA